MRSLTRNGQAKLHAVCVPFPAQGHINPMLKLAKLLHSKGFHITFVNTEFTHNRILRSRGPNSLDGLPSFKFETISDGLPPSNPDTNQDPATLFNAILNNCLEPFKRLILKLNDPSLGSPPVSFILSDCAMPFTLDAAHELGNMPVVLLWTASACGFLGYLEYRSLLDKGIVPFEDPNYLTNGNLDMIVDWVPSMKGIRLKDFPSFIRTLDKDDLLFHFPMFLVEKSCQSSSPILFNTFDELESDVLKDISSKVVGTYYTIGPLLIQQIKDTTTQSEENVEVKSLGVNMWKEDTQCLEWLESKKPNSVIYVSFGSVTTLQKEILIEFAWGLANSNHPFLWIVRPDIVFGEFAILPHEFLDETKDRGMLVNWCNQEKVLAHKSIGAFLTHCGWNSSLEAICRGLPVLCWPFLAEQQTNCWYICNKLAMGIEINSNVKRDEVEKQVRELLEGEKGEELRKNALKWKRLAEEVIKPTGSSYKNLEQVMNQVFLLLKNMDTTDTK